MINIIVSLCFLSQSGEQVCDNRTIPTDTASEMQCMMVAPFYLSNQGYGRPVTKWKCEKEQ